MLTSVDTSILLDIFGADPKYGPASSVALNRALQEGSVVACEVVWAETRALFPSEASFTQAMQAVGIGFLPLNQVASIKTGTVWQQYRQAGGKRNRVVADFMIACHALTQTDRLLTRDRGFYHEYFTGLKLMNIETP